jgi:peptidoglycan/xylan/chitin deacetylase (PgdA/CDA1 family)
MSELYGATAPPNLRRRILDLAHAGLHASGAAALYARRAPASATVLMYHSVPEPAAAPFIAPRNQMSPALFERQMNTLARQRRVVGIDAVGRLAHPQAAARPGPVVLTFDDGYRDNLDVVAPILKRLGLPAVLYLCTGYIDRGHNQWADMLYAAIRHRRRDRLQFSGQPPHTLDSPEARLAAYRQGVQAMLSADLHTRQQVLDQVFAQLDPDPLPPRLTLTWDEVRTLRDRYPEFVLGVHTADHLDMAARSVDDAMAELRRCCQRYEEELGAPPRHFSFPYSRVNPEVVRRLPELGLVTAMGGTGVIELARLDPLDVPRLEAPEALWRLRYWTGGSYPYLARSLFGRS